MQDNMPRSCISLRLLLSSVQNKTLRTLPMLVDLGESFWMQKSDTGSTCTRRGVLAEERGSYESHT
jgi:hypothetical protein